MKRTGTRRIADWPDFMPGYRSLEFLPYRWPAKWADTAPVFELENGLAITAEDSYSDSSKRIVLWDSPLAAIGAQRLRGAVDRYNGADVLARAVGQAEAAVCESAGLQPDGRYFGMGVKIEDLEVGAGRKWKPGFELLTLREAPELVPDAVQLLNVSRSSPMNVTWLNRLLATNPAWSPDDFVVARADEVATGMLRLAIEADALGHRYGIVRSLGIPPELRARFSPTVLGMLFAHMVDRFQAEGVISAHLETDVEKPALLRLYRWVNFEVETVVAYFRSR